MHVVCTLQSTYRELKRLGQSSSNSQEALLKAKGWENFVSFCFVLKVSIHRTPAEAQVDKTWAKGRGIGHKALSIDKKLLEIDDF